MPPPGLRRPADLDGPIPEIAFLGWEAPVYRIQDEPDLSPKAFPSPRHRFDAPDGQYASLYANDSRVGVFGEVYVNRRRRLGDKDASRHLLEIRPSRPLPLVDLRDDPTLAVLDLDARISVGDDYRTCQEWALAFYEAMPDLSGICYAARAGGIKTTNVFLFAERCAAELTVEVLGRLEELDDLVLAATDRYGLRASFLT